jgi:HD-like signal output (HDOD) protein
VNSPTTPATLAREVLDLVSLPEIYLKVRELLDDPGSSLADIAQVISVDPGLTSRILRIANSAFCGFAAVIETVPHAMSLLGTQQIHDLVLATSIARAFSGIPEELVNMEQFWRTSVLCGAHAKVIADNCGILDSERMFTVGLLAHVGRLVLYLRLPTAMREAHVDASQKGISIPQALENKLGFDDAAVAGELLFTWKLPDSLVEPVRQHTHPVGLRDGDLGTAIVHVASAIADTRDLHLDADVLIRSLDETAWLALELNRESLSDLRADSEKLANDIVEQFLPEPA